MSDNNKICAEAAKVLQYVYCEQGFSIQIIISQLYLLLLLLQQKDNCLFYFFITLRCMEKHKEGI
jgi:hypothetical protein